MRSPSMLDLDAPDHTRLRKLVSKAFTPRAIDALRPQVAGLVDELLAAMESARHVDLVDALAFPLPFTVIAGMLGAPPADHERIRQLSGTLVRALEPVAGTAAGAHLPDPAALYRRARDDGQPHRRRITVKPVTVGGTEIPAGELVVVSLASANRDERFWGPDAAELRVDRENARSPSSGCSPAFPVLAQ